MTAFVVQLSRQQHPVGDKAKHTFFFFWVIVYCEDQNPMLMVTWSIEYHQATRLGDKAKHTLSLVGNVKEINQIKTILSHHLTNFIIARKQKLAKIFACIFRAFTSRDVKKIYIYIFYTIKIYFIYFTILFYNSPNILISIFTYNLLK